MLTGPTSTSSIFFIKNNITNKIKNAYTED